MVWFIKIIFLLSFLIGGMYVTYGDLNSSYYSSEKTTVVATDYFQKLYGNNNSNYFYKGIVYNNFYYIIGGNNGMATLTKLSNTGDHIWTSQVNGTSAWNDLIVNSDGNVLLIGIYGSFDGMAQSMIGVVHQSTGNFISLKSMDFSHRESLTKIYLNPSPASSSFPYNLVGIQNDFGGAPDDISMMGINKDGNIGWRRIIDSGDDDEFYRDITPDGNNGEMLITGNRAALNNNGTTLTLDKNGAVVSGRLFNVNTTFNTILTKQNLLGGNNHILAGKNNTSNVAQIVKVNGNAVVFSHNINQLNTITRLYPMGLSNFIAIGYGIFSGVNRPVMVHLTDTGNTLILNWARTFNDGENQYTYGYGDIISPTKYMYTDARNGNAKGFGNMDAFISVDSISLDNCLDQNVNVALSNTSVSFSAFNPSVTVHEHMSSTNRTGSLISYTSSDLCALTCEVSFTAMNQNCGTVHFNSSTNLPSPVTYQWSFGTTPQTTSNILNPIKKYAANGTYNVCLTVTNGNNSCTACKNIIVSNADVQAPVVVCPNNIQLLNNPGQCYAFFSLNITATDNCDPEPVCTCIMTGATTGNFSKNTTVQFNTGTTNITCRAADVSGNISPPCTFTVTVFDSEPPKMVCPPNITIGCNQEPTISLTGMGTATDNCPSVQISFTDIFSGNNCMGTFTRTWLATDVSGSITPCSQIIKKIDNIAPIITCPESVTISCFTSSLPANTGMATATDNCQTSLIINYTDIKSGLSCDTIITRTWTASDGCGNVSTCVQNILKKDDIFLHFQCPSDLTINCDQSADPVLTGNPITNGNCPGTITTSFSDIRSGILCDTTITRTWTASDNCGNTSSCVQIITKKDNVAPVITCPANVSVACNSSTLPAVTGQATATDNCQTNINITFSDAKSGTACDSTITRTWAASDNCGNTSSCVQIITKKDNITPVITCPSNVSVACNSSTLPSVTGQATATDNCQTNINITFSDAKLGTACDSTITRTWTASDNCGNTSSCVQIIIKKDNIAPVISCPANVSVACNSSTLPSVTGQATATDNCQTNINITFSDAKSGTACDSTITRTWTASDNCGNTSSCVQIITKKDNVAPVITCPANVSVACNSSTAPSVAGQATATDNCQNNITINFSDTKSGTACDSTITRTWTATDNCGNTSSCVQIITKRDNVAPVIACPANISVACNSSTTPSVTGQATATDNCQTNLTITFFDVKSGTACDSTISRTWAASDNCGNTSSCVQVITKRDNVPPVVTCPANVSVACNSSTAPSVTGQASATDNCQTNITITFSDAKSGTACDSTIIRTWTASDNCGNTSSCVQIITIKDNVAPVISCPANISVTCNSSTTPSITGQATATDNCQNNISITFSDIKSGTACDTTINRTWTASDECGNISSCVQIITKRANVAPVITCPANISVACNSSTAPSITGQATIIDNCQTNITITFSDIKSGTACDSTITRTWTASDNCGNTSSCKQIITKMDNVAPVITCTANVSVACNSSILPSVTGQATATDNCQTNINITFADAKSGTACDSIITRTWTASDNCGNSSTCVQTITKMDNVAPVITCPASLTVACNSSTLPLVTGQATATDNCQTNVSITFSDAKSGTACDSTITRTWTASDNCGNTSSCVQIIIKKDNIAPVISCPANVSVACNSSTAPSVTGQATATDNCQTNITITFSDAKSGTACDSTITRRWTASDNCGNTSSCVQTIIKKDTPIIVCCNQTNLDSLLNKSFNIIENGCRISISSNQFNDCHFLKQSPDFGDGKEVVVDLFPANGVWAHDYDTSGTYIICLDVIAKDENGNICVSGQACKTIEVFCDADPVSCCKSSTFFENDNIIVQPNACDLCLTYNQKDSCDFVSVNFGAGFQAWPDPMICFTYPDTGRYEVCIKSERYDIFGDVCFEKDTCFMVKISCDENEFCTLGDIIVPNGITPNGDGINDYLIINSTNDCKSFDVSIYNRWGQLVYIQSRYNGEWHGQSNNGSQLPDGTYYLILSLPKPSTEKRTFKTFIDLRTK